MYRVWRIAQKQIGIEICEGKAGREWAEECAYRAVSSPESMHTTDGLDIHLKVRLQPVEELQKDRLRESAQPYCNRLGTPIGYRLESHGLSGILLHCSHQYKGWFNLYSDGNDVIYFLLHKCFSLICMESKQVFLHASAVVRKGRLWLFSGPSGSGKTTIATQLHGGGQSFSLDKVILSLVENNHYRVYSTPFSDVSHITGSAFHEGISGILLIEQSERTEILGLPNLEKIRKLLAQTVIYYKTQENIHRYMESIFQVVEYNRCFGMKFEKNESFWRLLDQLD